MKTYQDNNISQDLGSINQMLSCFSIIRNPNFRHHRLVYEWSGFQMVGLRKKVRFSNGRLPFEIRTFKSGFQIPFENRTISQPTSLWPFEIRTCPDFRSPLYTEYIFVIIKLISCFWLKCSDKKWFQSPFNCYISPLEQP